jgi:hypothetical protein
VRQVRIRRRDDRTLGVRRRLALSLPPAIIAYLRSPDSVKVCAALLGENRKASSPPGFERLLAATIDRTRDSFQIMLHDQVRLIFGRDTPGVDGFCNPPSQQTAGNRSSI